MDILKAIQKLKARNQAFVNKSGITDYSQESDNIISSLVEYYNTTQEQITNLSASNTRLINLLVLFGVPVDSLKELPDWFIKVEPLFRSSTEKWDICPQPADMVSIFNDYVIYSTDIDIMFDQVMFYHRLNDQQMKTWFLTNYPELEQFINIPSDNLKQSITDYYVRAYSY